MNCQSDVGGHHRARCHGESETRASPCSSKSRRIAELEDELERLRLSTKAALEQSWDETERLQRTSAEKDETINTLRRELAESKSRERQWRHKYEEVYERLLAQSRAASRAVSPSVLDREIDREIEQQNEVAFQEIDYYGVPITVGCNDDREDARSDDGEVSVGGDVNDVSNRGLFRTLRKSIDLISGGSMRSMDVAPHAIGTGCGRGNIQEKEEGNSSWLDDSWTTPHQPQLMMPLHSDDGGGGGDDRNFEGGRRWMRRMKSLSGSDLHDEECDVSPCLMTTEAARREPLRRASSVGAGDLKSGFFAAFIDDGHHHHRRHSHDVDGGLDLQDIPSSVKDVRVAKNMTQTTKRRTFSDFLHLGEECSVTPMSSEHSGKGGMSNTGRAGYPSAA